MSQYLHVIYRLDVNVYILFTLSWQSSLKDLKDVSYILHPLLAIFTVFLQYLLRSCKKAF